MKETELQSDDLLYVLGRTVTNGRSAKKAANTEELRKELLELVGGS